MRKHMPITAAVILSLMLSGCQLQDILSGFSAGETTPSMDVTDATFTPTPLTDVTPPTPTAEIPDEVPINQGETVLTVWTAEALSPSIEAPGGQDFQDQLAAFDRAFPDIRVEVYVKRATGPGSTLAYLRSAPSVAPGILPDLALLDRESLVQAARENLVVPIGPLLDPAILPELYPVAQNLGSVDEELVGLPYVLEVQHSVYRETLFREPPVSFADILESPVPYVFPAGVLGGVNHTILLQYMAAGGELSDQNGVPVLDASILAGVLNFYAGAREAGVVDLALFQITEPAVTWARYRDGQASLAAVTSTLYLGERTMVRSTAPAPTPTLSGQPYALVCGWSWVVVTKDPERQAAVMQLVNFLMEPTNQGVYSQAANWLPSQRTALAVWGDGDSYAAFGDLLLNNARLLPDTATRTKVGTAIQDALEDVLLNNMSPIQAANQAAQSVNPPESDSP